MRVTEGFIAREIRTNPITCTTRRGVNQIYIVPMEILRFAQNDKIERRGVHCAPVESAQTSGNAQTCRRGLPTVCGEEVQASPHNIFNPLSLAVAKQSEEGFVNFLEENHSVYNIDGLLHNQSAEHRHRHTDCPYT